MRHVANAPGPFRTLSSGLEPQGLQAVQGLPRARHHRHHWPIRGANAHRADGRAKVDWAPRGPHGSDGAHLALEEAKGRKGHRGLVAELMQQAVRDALIAFMTAICQAQVEVAKAARRYGLSAF